MIKNAGWRIAGPVARMTSVAVSVATATLLLAPGTAAANVPLSVVSYDPYHDSQAQHETEVESDSFQYGSRIVAAFQVGRVYGGGASNIGWATSTSGGSWQKGFLPGITGNEGGWYDRASDPSVAYNAADSVWVIASLGLDVGFNTTADVLTSRSYDGARTWSNPVVAAGAAIEGTLDKPWIVCDNGNNSPFRGFCYLQYTISNGQGIRMRTSVDSGLSWGPPVAVSGGTTTGLGGQPVVQSNGTVVVPYRSRIGTQLQVRSFVSYDGGQTWRSDSFVANISHHLVAGGLRESPLPSAEIDGAGTTYVTWSDCRFRPNCTSNDIVLAKSIGSTSWTAPIRIPIDPTTSAVDHFMPSIAIDKSTFGAGAKIGVTYYYYPNAACTAATCQLNVGFISSINAGSTWSAPTQIAGPMTLSWLPDTNAGRMFGDYIANSILPLGNAYPVIPVASTPLATYRVPMMAPTGGLPVTGGPNAP